MLVARNRTLKKNDFVKPYEACKRNEMQFNHARGEKSHFEKENRILTEKKTDYGNKDRKFKENLR